MRKDRDVARYHRYVLSGVGRSGGLPSCAESTEFPLAHLVAFQHAILHPVSGSFGFHNFRNFAAPTAPPRQAVHSFHRPRPWVMRDGFERAGCYQCHSERSEEEVITDMKQRAVRFCACLSTAKRKMACFIALRFQVAFRRCPPTSKKKSNWRSPTSCSWISSATPSF